MSDKLEAMGNEDIARAVAEKIATRMGLDTADGSLLGHPMLMLLFMIENLLDRIALLEEVATIKQKGGNGDGTVQPQSY